MESRRCKIILPALKKTLKMALKLQIGVFLKGDMFILHNVAKAALRKGGKSGLRALKDKLYYLAIKSC